MIESKELDGVVGGDDELATGAEGRGRGGGGRDMGERERVGGEHATRNGARNGVRGDEGAHEQRGFVGGMRGRAWRLWRVVRRVGDCHLLSLRARVALRRDGLLGCAARLLRAAPRRPAAGAAACTVYTVHRTALRSLELDPASGSRRALSSNRKAPRIFDSNRQSASRRPRRAPACCS